MVTDNSQNITKVNATGGKNVAKKQKNSASRTKESISKLSEKKTVKKDGGKKQFVNDNALSPSEKQVLDMTPNKQRSSSANNTKRSDTH